MALITAFLSTNMKKFFFYFSIFVAVLLTSCSEKNERAKNVIFMVGDGMGINQVYAALTANGGSLNVLQFPVTGFSQTQSANRYITDSAAGGTALATGTRTNNGMVGLAPDSVTPLRSSLYCAAKHGKSTGIVVTCPLTHATPAAFYGHQINREMHEELALDLLAADIDVMIGGGRNVFDKRVDNQPLIEQFTRKGYAVALNETDLQSTDSRRIFAPLYMLDLPVATKRGNYLPQAVEKAIDVLSKNHNGFFLVVEGSQIDYQCHNNNTDEMVAEMQDFDRAIGVALDFARRDGNTLVVVTADHETGLMSIVDGNFDEKTVECKFNSNYHSGAPVPVFAFGPGAERFAGFQKNTDFRNKILEILGINSVNQ